MKQISLWIILLLVQLSVFAQKDETIVKIDKVEYSSIEFDYHYRKNAKILDQRESPQMYLERFIDYKLKLAEALRLKLDTVNNFLTEFQNYKLSLSNKHNAQGIIRDSLVHIAYKRLNEARNVSIITILAPEGSDTVRAFKRADSLYQALRKGASFADLATTKSEDMALKPKKGNIGYITGNMLPIQLENVLYTLKKGEFSAPIRTQKGYHIFRVNDITINPGEMRIAHIVKFFGTDSTQNKARLDSMMLIHKEIKEGADFVKLAIMYSDDETVKETKAELPWFKINQVLPEYETNAYALKSTGDLSPVFTTKLGYHIIKLLEKRPVVSFEQLQKDLEAQIENSDRQTAGYQDFVERQQKNLHIKDNADLTPLYPLLTTKTPWESLHKGIVENKLTEEVFRIENRHYKLVDFASYLHSRFVGKEIQDLPTFLNTQYKAYLTAQIINHYNEQAIDKDPELSALVTEYHDGLLIFDLMQRQIWDPAKADTAAQRQYYLTNQAKYLSAAEIELSVVKSPNLEMLKKVKSLAQQHSDWGLDDLIAKTQIAPDTFRIISRKLYKGSDSPFISTMINARNNGDSLSCDYDGGQLLLYYIHEFRAPKPRTFNEVKGYVLADMQSDREREYLAKLRHEYSIAIQKKSLERYAKSLNQQSK